LCRAITCGQAADRRYGDERQWHSRYRASITRESHHSPERIKKKESQITHVNQSVLQHVHPEHVEVEIWRADALEVRRGLASELDVTFHIERWGFLQIMWRYRLAVHASS